MKNKSFFYLVFLVGFILFSNVTFSQEKKDTTKNVDSKKALDAFINATTKARQGIFVPNANVLIELLPGKKDSIRANEKGEFAISFSDIENIQGKNSKVVRLRFTITPDQNFQYKTANNIIDFELKKSDGSFFVFTLKYEQESPEIGNFFVVQEPLVQSSDKGKGSKQGKGSAVKTGESYQGEVRHF